jgi:exopolysaccharide biosynthesis polyprenyl glycosylphosphotransferase
MLEQENKARVRITKFSDAAIACAALVLTVYIRSLYPNAWGGYSDDPTYYWPLLLVCLVGLPMLLSFQGFYEVSLGRTRLGMIWALLKACLGLFVLMIVVQFFFKLEYSRPVLVAHSVLTFFLVLIREEFVGFVRRSKGLRDGFTRRVIVIGCPEELRAFSGQFSFADHIDVVEYVNAQTLEKNLVDQLADRLHRHSLNSVIVSLPLKQLDLAEAIIHVCEEEGVETILIAKFIENKLSTVECSRLFGQPVLTYSTSFCSSRVYEKIAKRCLDFSVGLILLMLFSPLLLLVAIAIKLTSSGPILFKQVRAGLNGKEFTIFKFRTMISNAETVKHEIMEMNEMSGPVFKISNDPRITSFGRLLRKYSIDEMPQFWNVVRGDMSLVGPRPLPVEEVKRFGSRGHRRRMSVTPGLTCLWQISGRNNIKDFDTWVKLDQEYIDTWSIYADIKILFRTIPAVLFGRGAK